VLAVGFIPAQENVMLRTLMLAVLVAAFAATAHAQVLPESDDSDYPQLVSLVSVTSENITMHFECGLTPGGASIMCVTSSMGVSTSRPESRFREALDPFTPTDRRDALRTELQELRNVLCQLRGNQRRPTWPEQWSPERRSAAAIEFQRGVEYRRALCRPCRGDDCFRNAVAAEEAGAPDCQVYVKTKLFEFDRVGTARWEYVDSDLRCGVESVMLLEGSATDIGYVWRYTETRRATRPQSDARSLTCLQDTNAALRFEETYPGMRLDLSACRTVSFLSF